MDTPFYFGVLTSVAPCFSGTFLKHKIVVSDGDSVACLFTGLDFLQSLRRPFTAWCCALRNFPSLSTRSIVTAVGTVSQAMVSVFARPTKNLSCVVSDTDLQAPVCQFSLSQLK